MDDDLCACRPACFPGIACAEVVGSFHRLSPTRVLAGGFPRAHLHWMEHASWAEEEKRRQLRVQALEEEFFQALEEGKRLKASPVKRG